MQSLAIVGLQFGDEGKGKLTDTFAKDYDVIVRYQGGNNAGHTVYANGQKYVLHLLPSGIIHAHTLNILANGMVIDLEALEQELRPFDVSRIRISNRAHLIVPLHRSLDAQHEQKLTHKIGTTLKGIGPAYQLKAARVGLRMASLLDLQRFEAELQNLCELYHYEFDVKTYVKTFTPFIKTIQPYIVDTTKLLHDLYKEGRSFCFEGAQGVMLDLDHGTYPFVTSSHPTPSSVPVDAGFPDRFIDRKLGIIKAYVTRVGEGSLPTEFDNDISRGIRERGHEYGATTGRPRRIGHLDMVMLQHAVRVSGANELAITLLDVLTGVDQLKIATHYELDGQMIDELPAHETDLARVMPHYQTFEGWHIPIDQCKTIQELPLTAKVYLQAIQAMLGIPIRFVSVGPQREQLIVVKEGEL
jgi:adenylosuccinate synthase